MFLRFTKCASNFYQENKMFIKAVKIGDTAFMELQDEIIGVARIESDTKKTDNCTIMAAGKNPHVSAAKIEAYLKRLVGNSRKYETTPSAKKRSYKTTVYDDTKLPLQAELVMLPIIKLN